MKTETWYYVGHDLKIKPVQVEGTSGNSILIENSWRRMSGEFFDYFREFALAKEYVTEEIARRKVEFREARIHNKRVESDLRQMDVECR